MNAAQQKRVVVIGAGLAGIAVAIRLRKAGLEVSVLEKNETIGGKLAEFSKAGFRWDKGPSLFTAPHLVDELFELCGKNPRDYFNYTKQDVACTYYFSDGTSVRFYGNHAQLKEELTAKFNADSAYRTLTYLERSRDTYKRIGDFFIDNPPVGMKDLFRKELIIRYPHFLTAKLRKTLHQYNHTALKDAKLVQVFDRFGTYNGSNPFKMSGLYSMIPHLEQNTGTFFPEKGMRSIADSLYKLAVESGVEFWLGQDIATVSAHQQKYWVKTASADFEADYVVCAIDHLPFYRDILRDEKSYRYYARQERSTSGLVFYWGVKEGVRDLGLHTILFSGDYRAEFDALFHEKKMPDELTVYIHISAAVSSADAPVGGQNWFVMINTPAGFFPSDDQLKSIRRQIFARIKKQFDVEIESQLVCEETCTSKGIEEQTGSYLGALYGASSNGKVAALKRHGNRNKKHPHVYFCGGTVHPGGGIPLVLKSAKIVAELIQRES